MEIKIEKIKIDYQGKTVTASKLTVVSEILLDIDTAWEKLQTSALLEFISKPKVLFKPIGEKFPINWSAFEKVSTKILLFGFIPFGGTHNIYFQKIDPINKMLQTKEWDNAAKIWNHTIVLKKLTNNSIYYTDKVVIYGGMLTGFIATWAKLFYTHRQKRWKLFEKNI